MGRRPLLTFKNKKKYKLDKFVNRRLTDRWGQRREKYPV